MLDGTCWYENASPLGFEDCLRSHERLPLHGAGTAFRLLETRTVCGLILLERKASSDSDDSKDLVVLRLAWPKFQAIQDIAACSIDSTFDFSLAMPCSAPTSDSSGRD